MIRRLPLALFLALVPLVLTLHAAPAAADKQAGYYYPKVTSEEEFTRHLIPGPKADAAMREAFVGIITKAQVDAPAHPRFVLFAKGDGSRRLIMVALEDGPFDTLYRARGVLAQLTYGLRDTPFFRQQGLSSTATFFDVLQLLDFESLTITDGKSWTHRIYFK